MLNTIPEKFISSLSEVLTDTEVKELLLSMEEQSPVSIRFNPYKLEQKPEGDQIPWSRYGFYLDERPVFTLDPFFHSGIYYVQEASSMFIEHIYREIFDEKEDIRVLDLCASPGGKTTLLSTMAGLDGLVVANEPVRQRIFSLSENVSKWGLGNVLVTNNDPSVFENIHHNFDLVVVDAPCSGEGMFRKNPESRSEWKPQNVELCSQRQKRILSSVWNALKPGGILIYSTCTFNQRENEDNVQWLAQEYGYEPVGLEIPEDWGIVKGEIEGIDTFRFFPHRLKGEGFFAAVMVKPAGKVRRKLPKVRSKGLFTPLNNKESRTLREWFEQPEYMSFYSLAGNTYGYYRAVERDITELSDVLTGVYSGVNAGQFFGGKLKPSHNLALFHDLNRSRLNTVDLDIEQAQDYLRKKDLATTLFQEGLNLVCYQNAPIGWIKRIGNRCNNGYPKELRIVNL